MVSAGEMFGGLLPIVEPFGATSLFLALTSTRTMDERVREARNASLFAFLLLGGFLFVGEPLLHYLGLSFESLEIAGGVIVGLVGLKMVFDVPSDRPLASTTESVAFSPIAMPMLAGPGAMAMVLAIESRVHETTTSSVWSTAGLLTGVALASLTVFAGLWLACRMGRFLSRAAIDAVGRVLGLIVVAIGVELIVRALHTHSAFGA
jgi:multiple antibiotic resistance protein